MTVIVSYFADPYLLILFQLAVGWYFQLTVIVNYIYEIDFSIWSDCYLVSIFRKSFLLAIIINQIFLFWYDCK